MIFSKHLQEIWVEWKFSSHFLFRNIRLFSFLDDPFSTIFALKYKLGPGENQNETS